MTDAGANTKSTVPLAATTKVQDDVDTTDATLDVAQFRNGMYPVKSLAVPPSVNDALNVCSFARNTSNGGAVCARLFTVTGYGAGAAMRLQAAIVARVIAMRVFMVLWFSF